MEATLEEDSVLDIGNRKENMRQNILGIYIHEVIYANSIIYSEGKGEMRKAGQAGRKSIAESIHEMGIKILHG